MIQLTKSDLNSTLWPHPDGLTADRKWWIVDAADKTLGRLAVDIANKLSGKHKPHFCDMRDCGDYVVVTNAEKIVVTGNKMLSKVYYRHSGFKGHLKETPLQKLLKTHPERAVEFAVMGMLAKNKLRKIRLKRLKVFNDENHGYAKIQLVPMNQNASK